MKYFSKKLSLAASTAFGCVALFGCSSSDSNNAASTTGMTSVESAVDVCGDYTAYEDGLGNTYCIDKTMGAVIYSVLVDGSIVYTTLEESSAASSDASSTDVGTSSASTASNAVCGETTNPTSIVGDLYFYSDAFGSYYYNITDASCTKVYLTVASSSSAAEVTSSETLATSSATATSSTTGVTTSSSSIASTGSTPAVTFSTSGVSVENNNNCVEIDGSVVKILCAGIYYFSGTSNDGQIMVTASTEDKVYLYLNGLTLTSSDAPIYSQSSDKTFIVAVSGTINTLQDGNSRTNVYSYTKDGETKTDTTGAVIYAKDDLTIKGSGTLNVTGNYNNGIHTTKDLKIKYDDEFGGAPTITVTTKNHALKGKNSVAIDGGTLTLTTSEGDGIKSDEDDATELAEGKGYIEITGGKITVNSGDKGIKASNYILIDDSVSVPTLTVVASGDSAKALKADSSIYIYAGTLNLTSKKDDGIHANAGITAVYGTDDGWNAAGGSKNEGASASTGNSWGGNMGGGAISTSVGYIVITGGYHYISVSGNDVDVLDANGTATQTGGVLILEILSRSGSSSGNLGGSGWGGGMGSGSCSTNQAGGLIDTDNGYTITGGVLLGFGSQTEEYPSCTATSYTNSNYYGSSSAAFKPQGSGSMIIYGGSVASVSVVDVSSMTAVNFPNGLTYYYK